MAKQSLEFTQSGNKYTASFVSAGTTVVQLEREYKAENNIGQLTVYAYIDGMNPVPVRNPARSIDEGATAAEYRQYSQYR